MKKSFIFLLLICLFSVGIVSAEIDKGEYEYTDKPIFISYKKEENVGKNYRSVLFGDWPQSLKSDDVIINETKTKNINGWVCYEGSDGCFYVKNKSNFVKEDMNKLSDIKTIESDKDNYFKMEPIKWIILSEDFQGGKLLFAENILDLKRFDNISNNYAESTIRKYLNDYFLNKAFSTDAIKKINAVTVDNSADTTTDINQSLEKAYNSACENTKDQVFLLSEKDVTNPDYGFNTKFSEFTYYESDFRRTKKTVNYASLNGDYEEWWLRSPSDDQNKNKAKYVDDKGNSNRVSSIYKKLGIVPAIVLSGSCFEPKEVIDFKVYSHNSSVNLSWKNPDDDSIDKIVISGFSDKDIELDFISNNIMTKEVTGLENGKEYNISINTVNKYGVKGECITKTVKPVSVDFATDILSLPEHTYGTAGMTQSYVLFGNWPQTMKSDSVTIESEEPQEICGWNCYKGSDGRYYVKATVQENNSYNYTDSTFSNFKEIKEGEEYYFEIEPIKWRVIENYNGQTLLLAENILMTYSFDKISNNYKESEIRKWLNSDFLASAFSPESISKINVADVDNSQNSEVDCRNISLKKDFNSCENTRDKIFLLSKNEVTNRNYGFEDDNSRRRYAVDFAAALGVTDYWWWLRSPERDTYNNYDDTYEYSFIVNTDGSAEYERSRINRKGGIVPALLVSKDVIPPKEIGNLKTFTYKDSVRLTWENSNDDDVSKIFISGFSDKDIELDFEPNSTSEYTVNNLETGKNYLITIKAENKNGLRSKGVKKLVRPLDGGLVTEPVFLPKGTDGSAGKEGHYLLFGNWPQSVKDKNVNIISSFPEEICGWECYEGSDNCYYVEKIASPKNDDICFSNFGYTKIEEWKKYYFKLEPIKWRILGDYQGEKLLLAENILEERSFDELNNKYDLSTVRNWLNHEFLNYAFTQSAADKINITEVDNGINSTTDYNNKLSKETKDAINNTNDKIFLLSKNELTNPAFGFKKYDEYDDAREKNVVDYVRATGYRSNEWWTRSPFYSSFFDRSKYVITVQNDGKVNDFRDVDSKGYGVVPAMVLSCKYIPQKELIDFKTYVYKDSVTLSWIGPEDESISKVIISGLSDKDIELDFSSGIRMKKTVENLKSGKEYNLSIKTINKYGQESKKITSSIKPVDVKLTTEPIFLPEGTTGTAGINGKYILFGDWPQSIKQKDVTILSQDPVSISGWTCYKGSDNCFYVKLKADRYFSNNNESFSNGEKIIEDKEYYFKLEPIKWRLIKEKNGGNLLLSEKIIQAGIFDKDSNIYENSDIRKWLNDEFLLKAFDVETDKKIKITDVDNSKESTIDSEATLIAAEKYASNNTKDKIFLLSEKESTNVEYGFSTCKDDDSNRKKQLTDFVKASDGMKSWWLRSPCNDNAECSRKIYSDGSSSGYDDVNEEKVGIVPALYILDNIIPPENVKEFETFTCKDYVNLSWINSSDENILKVIISGLGEKDLEYDFIPNEKITKKIDGLETGTQYNITIKTVNNYGLESNLITKKIKPLDKFLTTELKDFEGRTSVLFGDWPQSLKDEAVTILNNEPEESWGWTYYKGSDNNNYVKLVANTNGSLIDFNNGSEIVNGQAYYFKLEPIKWKILGKYDGNNLLLTENILAPKMFDSESTDYQTSQIKSWLNNEFLNKAFGEDAISKIETVTVDNIKDSKLFLLSKDEVEEKQYGFSYSSDNKRKKYAVDYAKANGGCFSKWWLRTPDNSYDNDVYIVSKDGSYDYSVDIDFSKCGVVPALVISDKYIPPKNVENIQVYRYEDSAKVTWKNPEDENISKLILSCDEDIKLECDFTPGLSMSQVIEGLEPEEIYHLEFKTINKYGLESEAQTKYIIQTVPKFTTTPVILPKGTDGTAGTDGTYILFGDWPQSKKLEDVEIDEDDYTSRVNAYGWKCYKGSDDFYYVKARIEDTDDWYFEGEKLITDEYYKLEPIKWRLLGEYGKGNLLLAENILSFGEFGKESNNYSESSVRKWLNNDFLENAFTLKARANICSTVVDNSAASTTDSRNHLSEATRYVCEDTTDYLFLLSEKEVTDNKYGFEYYYSSDKTRQKKAVDYAKRASAYENWWWLRSPNYNFEDKAYNVYSDGNSSYRCNVESKKGGIVPALVISGDYMPKKISDLKAVAGNGKVKLTWKNNDTGKIVIENDKKDDVFLGCTENTITSKEIKNLTNNISYTFKVKVVNNYGIESDSTEITCTPTDYKFTSKPIVMNLFTDGSYGKFGTYVLFGDWPQTIKNKKVQIYTETKTVINGWNCYKGSDGCYYVKAKAEPYEDKYKFSDGKKIEKGNEYYFKMEPIKWRLVTENFSGGKLLVAENSLINSPFENNRKEDFWNEVTRSVNGETIKQNNYKYSHIRTYLNGLDGSSYKKENYTGVGFINRAFTPDAIDLINTVKLKNNENSQVIEDKIFLLSLEELKNKEYDFKEDETIYRQTTDYSRATGVKSDSSWRHKNNSCWWLRDKEYSKYAFVVGTEGWESNDSVNTNQSYVGIVPALSISF